VIIIAYILFIFMQPLNKLYSRPDILYPLLTLILFTGGYFPFHFEARYLWIVNILLLLMGGKVLDELFRRDFFRMRKMRVILAVVFIISFAATPLKSVIAMSKKNINEEMYSLSKKLEQRYEIRGNIASNRKKVHMTSHDSWHNTFRLAYWLKSRYYGQARDGISDHELRDELHKNKIDYYFFWGDVQSAPEFLSRFRELTNGEIPGLKIYSLKEQNE
jgi:hypothetical protein